MPFSFLFNGKILVLVYSHFRGANLDGVWSWKNTKIVRLEIYGGQMHYDGKMIVHVSQKK